MLPGERVHIKGAKVNTQAFGDEGGEPKSLYFGVLAKHDVGGSSYVDISKKVTTYLPEVNHFVIGTIKNRTGESFIVDINAPLDGTLGGLEFDGASKRNRPNLSSGDIVFARIAEFSKFLGAKLSCFNAGYSVAKVLGQLEGGMVVYGLRGR